jgi:hypothetical protein
MNNVNRDLQIDSGGPQTSFFIVTRETVTDRWVGSTTPIKHRKAGYVSASRNQADQFSELRH